MTDSDRIFLRRHATAFAELCAAYLPWVLDGMEPQNRRSVQARRQTLAAGRARGLNDRELAGFFRIDHSTVWRALADEPESITPAAPESLGTALVSPPTKQPESAERLKWPARRKAA